MLYPFIKNLFNSLGLAKMKDRFDLEKDISALWSTPEDLKTVIEIMYDSGECDLDKVWNSIYGLAEVLEAKIAKVEKTYNQVFELNEFSPKNHFYNSEEHKGSHEQVD